MPAIGPMSRRRFLVLAGGAAALAACGGSGGTRARTKTLHGSADAEPTELSPAVMSTDLYARPEPQRFAFAMLSKEGFASGGPARLAVAPQGRTPTNLVDTTLYERGLPPKRGIYVADAVFDKAGVWSGVVERGNRRLTFAIQVNATAQAPVVGSAAPTAASPTPTNTLGVEPICTRNPPCPLHTTSLDTVIGKGARVAVLFATPARCQSRYCGPVLDSLLEIVDGYRDRITFVHVDIYRNMRTDDVAPTVAAWNLPSEPWLFGVDGRGTITARLDGAMGQDEMRALLDALAQA